MAFEPNLTLRAKNVRKRNTAVDFIVLHDTAGNGGIGDAKYLANDPERRGVSVDFCIPKDGTVYQLNHDLKGQCTFHAGRSTKFRGRTNMSVNQASIGIEIGQKANLTGLSPLYPQVQVKAVAETCAFLCKEFMLTEEDITTHKAIITDGTRSDPRHFPFDQFWTYFHEAMGDGTDPAEVPTDASKVHTVVEGDTLWSIARKYNTTVERVKSLSTLNTTSNLIVVGQVLRVAA